VASTEQPWAERWTKQGSAVSGGQGRGFRAVDSDGTVAFIKTLKHQRDRKARGRFRREVIAYENLAGAGVPALLEHNSDKWESSRLPLYLALQYIDGGNLGEWMATNGDPASFDVMTACVAAVGEVLDRGHALGVVHRDIKPKNIMVGTTGPAGAVLVDFGLSFNHAEDDELTRVGEEVGNRFLRLPEHAFSGRSPVSDVTQLTGIAFFLLTGIEPKVLRDELGRMPHQRQAARVVLQAEFTGRRLHRLLAVFDRGFAFEEVDRFQTADALLVALRGVDAAPVVDEFEDLMAQVDEVAGSPEMKRAGETRDAVRQLKLTVAGYAKRFGLDRSLHVVQTGAPANVPTGDAIDHYQVSVTHFGEAERYVLYTAERRGSEMVVSADGVEIWRGSIADAALERAVTEVAARAFLRPPSLQ
jgi:eukaryotic-like serine/threonine-protein kinase